jgi:D-alanine transfer protein
MKQLHIWAGIAAAALIAAIVGAGALYARQQELRYLNALAPLVFTQKNQGAALQRLAFAEPNMLPIYGASELVVAQPYQYAYRASALFQRAPTGFRVFPVGWHGASSLNMLQRLAAAGASIHGKKVVIIVSPGNFFNRDNQAPDSYAGNFSRLQANELAFSTDLSFELKQAAARRLLRYPRTLADDALASFALRQLADGSPSAQALYYAVLPLGKLHALVLRLQDHWELLSYIWKHRQLRPSVPRAHHPIDWQATLDQAKALFQRHSDNNAFGFDNNVWNEKLSRVAAHAQNSRNDARFLAGLRSSQEWGDLALLLRELRELGAQPLILSAPIDGPYYDYLGVSAQARSAYYRKLEAAVQPFGVPLRDFADHDGDTDFLLDFGGHPSAVGWVYFDQAIDEFYHGQLQ